MLRFTTTDLMTTPDQKPGPLSGMRILDLTSVVLGPIATQILGDFGAEIVKVEPLEGGDLMRANGVCTTPGLSSIFLSLNRNKRSMALNLKSAEGRSIFLELAGQCDALVHNMRVPAIERLGLGYEAVRAVNPEIVYCAATGFGQAGPWAAKPALDDIVQAACGIAQLLGDGQDEPSYVPTLMADKTAGLAVANATLAALLHRERTGEGQYVEVPMFETMVEFTLAEHMGGMAFVPQAGPPGYARVANGGRRPCRTADGWIAMLAYHPGQWKALFERIDRRDLIDAYDFSDRQKLNKAVRDLYRELRAITPSRTSEEWLAICEELDMPASRIYGLQDLPAHPQLAAVGMFATMTHPQAGPVQVVQPAVRFGRSPASVRALAPVLGQDSAPVLAELGYSESAIAAMHEKGIVHVHSYKTGR